MAELTLSLQVGEQGALKRDLTGRFWDGHHWIAILRSGDGDVDTLPREIISKD